MTMRLIVPQRNPGIQAAFYALIAAFLLTSVTAIHAEGLPYGGAVDAALIDGDLVILGDDDHNRIFVSTDPASIASFREVYGIDTPVLPDEVVIHGGYYESEDGQTAAPGEYSLINNQLFPVIFSGFTGDLRMDAGDGADDVTLLGVSCERLLARFGESPMEGTSRLVVDTCVTRDRMKVEKDGTGGHFSQIMSTVIQGKLEIDGGSSNQANDLVTGCWLIGSEVYGNVDLNIEGQYLVFQSSVIDGNLKAFTGIENCIAHVGGSEVNGNVCFKLGDGDDTADISFSRVLGNIVIDGGAGNDEYGIDITNNYDVFPSTTYRRLIVRKFERIIIPE